ncbi:uncharacterized protein LOC134077938 isoform X2 [Sardina pilchardus]|uniref:uncharacterized protein LOC134077938 isoform X2 n=1 Tax=Sardina pilchardus TaxID=27697 RepID=UPI002E0DB7FF
MFVCRGCFSLKIRMAERHIFVWIVLLLVGKISALVSHTPSYEVQEQPEGIPNTEGLQQVTVGECALLPCLLPHPLPFPGDIRVYWQTANTYQVVHVFNKGQEEFEHQASTYRNRTRLFTSQLQFGNFSLELHNVSEHDNLTTFQCLAMYDGSGRVKYLSNATLQVLKEDVNRSHDDDVAGNATVTAVAVAFLVLIPLALGVVWGMRKCLKKGRGNIHPVYFRKMPSGSTERDQQQQDEIGSTERDQQQQQEPLVSNGQEGEERRGEDS